METLFNLKQVVLHQGNNSDEEVSGEINYPQPDNTACVTAYILAVYILVLLTILPFFSCIDCLETVLKLFGYMRMT